MTDLKKDIAFSEKENQVRIINKEELTPELKSYLDQCDINMAERNKKKFPNYKWGEVGRLVQETIR